jgi:hypothetical protein
MKRLKQIFILITIFSISGIGITYAASATGNQIQNFFLGNAPLASGNLNQVLALLVGPKGPPGPAGVAGRDGFVGMNGTNGLDGAPGPAGANGASVLVVALQPGDKNCPIGGSKLTDGNGAITYVCNGQPGAPGPAGANGTNGTNGTNGAGSSDTITVGNGLLNVGTCATSVNVNLNRQFTGTQFLLTGVSISGIPAACGTATPSDTLTVYLPIKSTGAKIGPVGSNYSVTSPAQQIKCTIGGLNAAMLPSASNTITLQDSVSGAVPAAVCRNITTNQSILIGDISAQDLGTTIGLEIANQ